MEGEFVEVCSCDKIPMHS